MHAQFTPATLRVMYDVHGLPDGWESMEYRVFLEERRERIAKIIERGYATLKEKGAPLDQSPDLGDLVVAGEGPTTEFKSSLRLNRHTGQTDARMEHAVIKTIAGFLNTHGGQLVIGIMDDGMPVGIADDGFASEDKMSLHLVNLLRSRLGPQTMMYIHPRFEDYHGVRVLVVECAPAKSPVYLRDGHTEQFFIRAGPSSAELKPSEIQAYIKQRFG